MEQSNIDIEDYFIMGALYNQLFRRLEHLSPSLKDKKSPLLFPEITQSYPFPQLGLLFTQFRNQEFPPHPLVQASTTPDYMISPPGLERSRYVILSTTTTNKTMYHTLKSIPSESNRQAIRELTESISYIRSMERVLSESWRSARIQPASPQMSPLDIAPVTSPLFFEFGTIPPIDAEQKTRFTIIDGPDQWYSHLLIKPEGKAMERIDETCSIMENNASRTYELHGKLYLPEGLIDRSIFAFFAGLSLIEMIAYTPTLPEDDSTEELLEYLDEEELPTIH